MSPEQCRTARTLLNWSRPELAAKANCAANTISNFELKRHALRFNRRRAIQRVVQGEGFELLLAPEGLKFKGKVIDVQLGRLNPEIRLCSIPAERRSNRR